MEVSLTPGNIVRYRGQRFVVLGNEQDNAAVAQHRKNSPTTTHRLMAGQPLVDVELLEDPRGYTVGQRATLESGIGAIAMTS